MKKVWGAKLAGHEFDLADWREEFKAPFDPCVELIHREEDQLNVLWSSEFDDLENSEEVRDRASALIKALNGIMLLCRNGDVVRFDGSVKIEDGKAKVSYFMALEPASVRVRPGAVGLQVTRADGTVEQLAPTNERTRAQDLVSIAVRDDLIADAFVYLASATNWYDLYKVIELIEKKHGGEHGFAKQIGDKSRAWKDAKTTANFYRHARSHRPDPLKSFNEARATVLGVVRDVV